MNKDQIMDHVTETIINQLEKNVIPWIQPWFNQKNINGFTGKVYNGINQILLAVAKNDHNFSSNIWLTEKQVIELKGSVKVNSNSIQIVFYSFFEKLENGTEKKKTIPLMRLYNVFNLDQTENIDQTKLKGIQTKKTVNQNDHINACVNVIENYKNCPKINVNQDKASYKPSIDQVFMPNKETFSTLESFYATLFHELIHSTGHKTKLNRSGICSFDYFGSEQYSKEELIAELGSSMLCSFCGIENESIKINSVAYLQSWIKALKNDKSMIMQASSKAKLAVQLILNDKESNKK